MADPTNVPSIARAVWITETTARTLDANPEGADYVRTWELELTNANDGPIGAVLQPEIPRRYEVHPQDFAAFVTDHSVEAIQDSETIFRVRVLYGTKRLRDSDEGEADPLLRAVQYAWGTVTTTEPFFVDIDGKSVENSAKEPIVGESYIVTHGTIVITRNEAVFPLGRKRQFENTINDAPFFTYPTGHVRFASIAGNIVYERQPGVGVIQFARVTYSLETRQKGWNEGILDQGTRELLEPEPDPNGDWIWGVIKDRGQYPFQQFTLLDGTGRKLRAGQPPVLLPFKKYAEADFSTLGLEP